MYTATHTSKEDTLLKTKRDFFLLLTAHKTLGVDWTMRKTSFEEESRVGEESEERWTEVSGEEEVGGLSPTGMTAP